MEAGRNQSKRARASAPDAENQGRGDAETPQIPFFLNAETSVSKTVVLLEIWRLLAGKPRWTAGMVDAIEREGMQ